MSHSQLECWHDYHLTGYIVDGESGSIEFKLSWPYDSVTEARKALLVFTQVEGYLFEHDLGVNIISAISEIPLAPFLEANQAFFTNEKKWNWPLFWQDAVITTAQYLKERKAKVWAIDTSYGLCGWVVARGTQVQIIE